MTISDAGLTRLCKVVVFISMAPVICCTSLHTAVAAELGSPPPVVAQMSITNMVISSASTNEAKIVHRDKAKVGFRLEEEASLLAKTVSQNIHIRNGHAFVVVRLFADEGEYAALTKLRAKFRALEILRQHFPSLPMDFNVSCRVLFFEKEDNSPNKYTCVLSFRMVDLKRLMQ